MYSVVLMMALTGGAESTDFGRRGGCHGCNGGCTGVVAASCSGCSCHGSRGCHGSYGCNGGSSCHGGRGGLFHRNRGGCHGCSGYCNGGCYGCTGCSGISHGCCGGTYVVPSGAAPATNMPKEMPKETVPTPPAPPAKGETSASATIVVIVPADARLTVDGNPTTSTSERRVFVSPALETGSDYVYSIQAEVVRDGRTVTQTREITVRAGLTTNVPFSFPTESVASR
jgi:uncharacterized protein (TIGR03000 family)